MTTRQTFAADPKSVPAARRFATGALPGLPTDLLQSVELMVSELATNGIRHGQTSFDLEIEQAGNRVRVAVTDSGGGTPTMRFPTPDEPTGRGLQIVDMLSEDWGVDDAPGSGKTVWFTVELADTDPASESSGFAGRRDKRPLESSAWTFMRRGSVQFFLRPRFETGAPQRFVSDSPRRPACPA